MSRDKQASNYLGRVKQLDCVLCAALNMPQESVTEAHHLRSGHGMSDRASDYLVIALCVDCHRGPNGFHGTKTLMKLAKMTELDLLAETIKALNSRALTV